VVVKDTAAHSSISPTLLILTVGCQLQEDTLKSHTLSRRPRRRDSVTVRGRGASCQQITITMSSRSPVAALAARGGELKMICGKSHFANVGLKKRVVGVVAANDEFGAAGRSLKYRVEKTTQRSSQRQNDIRCSNP
jgi:hypothetical protein